MEQAQYHQMLDVMANLSQVLKKEMSELEVNTINLEHILFIYYGITPPTRLFQQNMYTRSKDTAELRRYLTQQMLRKIRERYRWRKKAEELEIISQALFEKDVMFGNTHLAVPDSLHKKFRANYDTYRDGREIVVEIVNFWFQQLIDEEHLQNFDDQSEIEQFYTPPVVEKSLKDRGGTNMEEKEYNNMLLTVEELIRDLNEPFKGLSTFNPDFDMEDVCYALFDIPPDRRFLSMNGYHKTDDKEWYRKRCIINLQQELLSKSEVHRLRNQWKLSYLELLGAALVEKDIRFGKVLLDTPEEIKNHFLENFGKYGRPSDYFIKIVSYWQGLLIAGKRFEVFIEPKADSKVVTPSTLGRTASSNLPRNYAPQLTEEERWEEREKREQERYEPSASEYYDRDPYQEPNDDNRVEFDDDSSNWAYKERHDD